MKHTLTRVEELMDELQRIKQRLIEIYVNNGEDFEIMEDPLNEKLDSLNAWKMFVAGQEDYKDYTRFLHLPTQELYVLCQIPLAHSTNNQRGFVLMSLDRNIGFNPVTLLSRQNNLLDENDIIALFGATPEFNWELA